jgi:cytidine deaminase
MQPTRNKAARGSCPAFGDTKDMNKARSKLIAAAKAVCGAFGLGEHFSAGSVGAAILTAKGNIYTGICVDLACGLGFCAEVAAIAEMLKARETHVVAVVAMSNGGVLVAPCGRCRETIAQVDTQNLECAVILGDDRVVPLRELLPEHWLTDKEGTEQARGVP